MLLNQEDKLLLAVKKLQKKYNSEAFNYIYAQLSPTLYFICVRYLKDTDEASDALQEVFVIIYEKIETYKGEGSFEGWAKRITVRLCIAMLKKKKIFVDLSEVEIAYAAPDILNEEQLEDKELKEHLKTAMLQLPLGYRTIVNLHIVEGYSHVEIAEILTISAGTSRSQLNRAKVALRKLISARK